MKYFFFLFSIVIFSNYSFGAAPTNQATNFSIVSNNAWKFNFIFTKAIGGAEGYLILINNTNNFTAPTDGKAYLSGAPIGNAKVNYVGTYNNLTIKNVAANTKYYIKIYAFNNIITPSYNFNNPLTDSVTTTGKNIQNYYKDIYPGSPSFISSLTTLLNNHTMRTYDDFEKIIVPGFYERDTVVNDTAKKVVQCEYSNERKVYPAPFDFANNSLNYSREHVLPKNWMNTRGIPNGDLINYPEGCDYHNLLLTRTTNVNSSRSDYPYGKVNTVISSYLSCKFGKDLNNQFVFEPKNDIKGNGVRCMFYQMITYNGLNINWGLLTLNGKASSQSQDLLKEWHITDPVDNYEIARNEFIFSLQGNRNPFIDFPEWVDCINFLNITALKCASTIIENKNTVVDYILKVKGANVSISFTVPIHEQIKLKVYNTMGQLVQTIETSVSPGENHIQFELENQEKSMYILQIHGVQFNTSKPIKFSF